MFDRLSVWLARRLGHPVTFVVISAMVLACLVLAIAVVEWREAINLWAGAITGYVSMLLMLILQNSQNREAAAAQAKADEVVRVLPQARNELIRAENKSVDEIETLRNG